MVVALIGLDNMTAYRLAQENTERDMERVREDPLVKREIEYFTEKLEEAEDPEEFLDDPRIITFLTKSLGMRDQAQNLALVQRGLLSDPEDPESLANRLVDTRYADAAKVFEFSIQGLDKLRSKEVFDTIVQGYVTDERELALSQGNPAVPDAMAFKKAVEEGRIESAYSLLGDPILRRVTLTALQLPVEIAFQTVEAQAKAIDDRLDIEKFDNPDFATKFVERFLILDQRSGSSQGSTAWQLGLFGGQASSGFLIPGTGGILV